MTAHPPHTPNPGSQQDADQAKQVELQRREQLLNEIEALEQALMSDLDAPPPQSAPPRPMVARVPPPPQPPRPPTMPAPAPAPEPQVRPAVNLLEKLRAEAQARNVGEAQERDQQQERERQLDRALREVFSYCHDLAQQLNVLHPEVAREYFLAGDLVFKGLNWEHGRADYRTVSNTERQLFRQVSFSWRLSGGTPLRCEREGPAMERLANLLYDNGVHFECHEIRNATRRVERAVYKIPQTVPAGSRWEADTASRRLNITLINLDRFSVLAYKLDPAVVNRELLDDFGALVLGMPNTFLRRLDRN